MVCKSDRQWMYHYYIPNLLKSCDQAEYQEEFFLPSKQDTENSFIPLL